MNYTEDMMRSAKNAKSAEELIAAAKESGVEMTAEEAEEVFAKLHREAELSEEELDNVTGGCGSNVPDKVSVDSNQPMCPSCGAKLVFETNTRGDGLVRTYYSDDAGNYDIFACSACGKKYRHHWNGDLWTKN